MTPDYDAAAHHYLCMENALMRGFVPSGERAVFVWWRNQYLGIIRQLVPEFDPKIVYIQKERRQTNPQLVEIIQRRCQPERSVLTVDDSFPFDVQETIMKQQGPLLLAINQFQSKFLEKWMEELQTRQRVKS